MVKRLTVLFVLSLFLLLTVVPLWSAESLDEIRDELQTQAIDGTAAPTTPGQAVPPPLLPPPPAVNPTEIAVDAVPTDSSGQTAEVDVKKEFPKSGEVKLADVLNVRNRPWGDIIGVLHAGDSVTILAQEGNWYRIEYQGGPGYIHASYVQTAEAAADAFSGYAASALKVYSGPDGESIGELPRGFRIEEVLKKQGEWYEIKYQGRQGYVRARDLSRTPPPGPPETVEPPAGHPVDNAAPPVPAGTDARAAGAIAWARQQMGRTDYSGWCQKFVHDAYRAASPRYASAKACWQAIGHKDSAANIANVPVGALLFFDAHPTWGHVAIHIGGGKFIHGVKTVRIDDLSKNAYWQKTYLGWGMPPASWPGR